MKSKVYLIISIFIALIPMSCLSQIICCNLIDSITIKQLDFYMESFFPIKRNDFDEFIKSDNSSVQTHITNKKQILEICFLLNNLQLESDSSYLKVMPCDIRSFSKEIKGHIYNLNNDPLDIRAKIILFSKSGAENIWIDISHIDMYNHRYKMSENLFSTLQNYYKKD